MFTPHMMSLYFVRPEFPAMTGTCHQGAVCTYLLVVRYYLNLCLLFVSASCARGFLSEFDYCAQLVEKHIFKLCVWGPKRNRHSALWFGAL